MLIIQSIKSISFITLKNWSVSTMLCLLLMPSVGESIAQVVVVKLSQFQVNRPNLTLLT